MLRRFRPLVLFFSLLTNVCASANNSTPIFDLKKSNREIIREYLKVHKKFSRALCRPGVEQEFLKHDKNYRGDGLFIPTLSEGELDKDAIKKNLPVLEKKLTFIKGEIKKLKKKKSFKRDLKDLKSIERGIDKLLNLKKKYRHAKNKKDRLKIRKKSRKSYEVFRKGFRAYIGSISYLKPFLYPVDHFNLRMNYDEVKDREDRKGLKKKNSIYLYRKIVEDGAQSLDHKSPDIYTRANISTISIRLKNNDDFISEDLRFDIEKLMRSLKRFVSISKKEKLNRLIEWKKRTERSMKLYRMLVDNKFELDGKSVKASELLSRRSKARYILKDFVLKKKASTYKFWTREKELFQALFSLETILFNEVGRMDSYGAPERKDVLQVAINRKYIEKYSTLDPREELFEELKYQNIETQNYPWLNVMFRRGEFSFTYFFIHGNSKIYCPDMSRRGRSLRKENLSLAINLLKRPNSSFGALRYFSRGSMLGSIDIGLVWKNFERMPESPGVEYVKNHARILRAYQRGHQYLYSFLDKNGNSFDVIRISDKIYVKSSHKESFFVYRNPHYFRYFEPLKVR